MPDVQEPIVVNPSPAASQTATASRDVLLLVAALPALIAVFGTRDVKQIVDFIASAQFAPVLGLIVGGVVVVWRQINARRKKAELVTVAEAAPNSVAVVVPK